MSDPNIISRISIKVQPGSSRNQIAGFSEGVWRIKIAAAPDKGKANKELIDYLSEILGLKKANLEIIRGHTSHNKLISIQGLTAEEISSRFSSKK